MYTYSVNFFPLFVFINKNSIKKNKIIISTKKKDGWGDNFVEYLEDFCSINLSRFMEAEWTVGDILFVHSVQLKSSKIDIYKENFYPSS
jgi:hypothetical protein